MELQDVSEAGFRTQSMQDVSEADFRTQSMETLAAEKENILEKAGKFKAQAASDFCADMRKMINNPDYSDIVFICQDGVRVHASRLFLVARSKVLNCMLKNGMVESRLSEITLPQVTSPVLLSVMEFLYTGILLEQTPKNWKNAFEIIGAARFFLLQDLELILLEYLLNATTDVESDMTSAAKFLSVAVEFDTLSDSIDIIPRDLVSILSSRCLDSDHLQALSDNAFHYFLQKTNNEHADAKTLSFDEYLRFRQVVLWCGCRLWPEEAEEVVKSFMPDMKSSLAILKNPLHLDTMSPRHPNIKAVCSKDDLALSVANFLSMVDLRRIHPELLIHVIEPMGIISSSYMMEAMRFHALQRSRKAEKKAHEWHYRGSKNTDIYSVCRDGSVIEQIAPGIGFVRYTIAINRPYGVYEWDIIIEKVCDRFCEIGILNEANRAHVDGSSLAEQPGGWALRMDLRGVYINRRGTHRVQQGDPGFAPYGKDHSQRIYGKDFGHKNTRIRVHLDMFEHTCSFFVDKENFGVAWSNLPDGTYYPAVSLGGGCRGRARIQLISGFDIL